MTTPSCVKADHVFLLMKHDFRISRNTRAQWYFQHLNKRIKWDPLSNDDSDESVDLEIVGIVGGATKPSIQLDAHSTGSLGTPCRFERSPSAETIPSKEYQITASTIVTFLSRSHRLVFLLDLSPSLAVVDNYLGNVLYDKTLRALEECLSQLTHQFLIPGGYGRVYAPSLFVTIIAYSPFFMVNTRQVVLQGCLVTSSNLDDILKTIRGKLLEFEDIVSRTAVHAIELLEAQKRRCESITGGLFDDRSSSSFHEGIPKCAMVSPDTALINILRKGILAVQLLPENTSASLVVITDGVLGIPDTVVLNAILTQLRSLTIACSFIQVRSGYHPECSFGHVPYSELMQFLAMATFGAYMPLCPKMQLECSCGLNLYQKAILCWTFQRAVYGFRFDPIIHQSWEESSWNTKHPSFSENSSCPLLKKQIMNKLLTTSLQNILYIRLREGYTISDVSFSSGDETISVKLILPWHDHVNLVYKVTSKWPLNKESPIQTKCEIWTEAPYEFFFELEAGDPVFRSPYRRSVINCFRFTIESLTDADQLLMHLHSFNYDPAYYTIPDGVKKGMSLFIMRHDGELAVWSKDYQEKYPMFCAFWSRVCRLNINIWQKWLHTHRISLILEHDTPLPQNMFLGQAGSSFSGITCRVSLTNLHEFLRQFADFTLMEKHSYISFIYDEGNEVPAYFYIIRLILKPPCVTLRIAFLGGVRGVHRNEIVQDLRDQILSRRIIQRRDTSMDVFRQTRTSDRKSPVHNAQCEMPTCTMILKPVEKLLIRYSEVPHDLSSFIQIDDDSVILPGVWGSQDAVVATHNRVASTVYNTLSRYLRRRRWIWSLKRELEYKRPFGIEETSLIVQTLIRRRLREGFKFASTVTGILNMVIEVKTFDREYDSNNTPNDSTTKDGHACCVEERESTCVLQYILFPPMPVTEPVCLQDESSDDTEDDDMTEAESCVEADSDLFLVTELWLEPQHGTVESANPVWCSGTTYKEFMDNLHTTDRHIIECVTTFEHLSKAAKENSSREEYEHIHGVPKKSDTTKKRFDSQSFCQSDVISLGSCIKWTTLLSHSQQASLFFSCLSSDKNNYWKANEVLYIQFMKELGKLHDVHLQIPPEQLASVWNHLIRRYDAAYSASEAHDWKWKKWSTLLWANCVRWKHKTPKEPVHETAFESAMKLPRLTGFVKVAETDRLVITFAPSSLKDVVLLNGIREDAEAVPDDSSDGEYSVSLTTTTTNTAKGSVAFVPNASSLEKSTTTATSEVKRKRSPSKQPSVGKFRVNPCEPGAIMPLFVCTIYRPLLLQDLVHLLSWQNLETASDSDTTPLFATSDLARTSHPPDLFEDYTVKSESVLSSLHRQISHVSSCDPSPRPSRYPSVSHLTGSGTRSAKTRLEDYLTVGEDDFDLSTVCVTLENAYSVSFVQSIYMGILQKIVSSNVE